MFEVPQPEGSWRAPVPAGRPTIHGVYDFWLGGGQHLRADRELAQAIAAKYPSVPAHIRAAQQFHLDAARWCAEQGITRFIHAGHLTALPEGRNVHDAARQVDPGAEVIYAYRNEGAHALSEGLLSADGRATAVLVGEGGILGGEPVRAWMEDGEPVCVIAGMLLHFAPADRAASRVARLAAALPPGSVFVVTMALAVNSPRARDILGMFTPGRTYQHTAADLEGWLDAAGLKMMAPGVMDVLVVQDSGWEREAPGRSPGFMAGALAAKP